MFLAAGLLAAAFFPAMAQAQAPQRIKWAFIGNSLTAGYPQASLTYVSGTNRLAPRIGLQDTLRNFGVSSSTLLKKGDVPYWTRTISGVNILSVIMAWQPDIVSIELGTNDTKAVNWQHNSEFVADLTALVDTLSAIASHPDIYLMLPPPIYTNSFGINDSIMTYGVIPKIQQVAAAKGVKILDANTRMRAIATSSPTTYYSDGVHFTTRGADSLAAVLYREFLSNVIRISTIGNSITAGSTLTTPLATAYPVRLNMRLGRKYYVKNGGVSGAYMQKVGGSPYWGLQAFRDVFAFKPHIITIALGTNDSRAIRWNTARFMTDYRTMIDTLTATIVPAPKFWLIKPMPAWYATNNSTVSPSTPAWGFDNGTAGNGINGFTIRDSVLQAVQQVATEKGWPTVDFYTPMLMGQPYVYTTTPSHTPDGVHPRELGHDTLAAVLYRTMLPGLTALRPDARNARNLKRAQAKARLMPVLSPLSGRTRETGMRLFGLDGKAAPSSRLAAGVYLAKPAAPADNARE